MRRAALAVASLFVFALAAPTRAQESWSGSPPCLGLCQLWPGNQAEAAPAAAPDTEHRLQRRHRRWHKWALRGRPSAVAERDTEEPGSRALPHRRHGRPNAPAVAVAKPAAPPVAQPSAVTPAVAGPPTAQPEIAPVATAPVPKAATAPGSNVPAAPLE